MTLVHTTHGVQPVLTFARNLVLDIQNTTTGPDDPMDTVLQKEMNLVQNLLAQSVSAEVPFTPY